jgi:pimeloyl-ACP methyl ester carboxylesterase
MTVAHALQRGIPGATLQVVDGGHYLPEEDPRPVADAVAALLRRN